MTTKTLADFFEVYRPKSPDEQKFVDKHVVIKHKDRNGNGDDVFNAKNIKKADRKKERHGYEPGEDEKVYEEVEDLDEAGNELMGLKNRIASNQKKMRAIPGIHPDKKRLAIQIEKDKKRHDELFNRMMGKNESIDEKTLTPAEMTKREEVVKAIKRGNPKMDKSMAYAIATKTAKRVAEEADLDEALEPWMGKNIDKPAYLRKKEHEDNKRDANPPKALRRIKEDQYEDFEQIDEISSKVVKNYLKKAWAGRDSGKPDRKGGVDFDHRRKGINLAYNFALPRNRQSDKEAAQAAAKLARRQNELRRQGKVVEDFEQIDEISSKVVKNYIKKAHAGQDSMLPDRKGGVEFDHRRKGLNLAYNFALPRNRASDKEAAQAAAKLARRQNELRRQGKVVEDFEQIDELSRDTLASYVKKVTDPKKANSKKVEVEFHNARKDAKHYERLRQGWSADGHEIDSDSPIASLHRKAVATRDRLAYAKDMRKKYVHKAIDKLAAEEVSQIDEISKGRLKNYLVKAFDGSRGPAATPEKFRKSVEMGTVAAKKIGQRFPGSKNVKVKVKATNEGAESVDEMRGTSYARPSKNFFRGPTAPSMPREKTEREKETDKGLAAIQAAFAKARKPKPITAEELATSFINRYMPEQADMPALTNEEKLVTALLDLNISETIASDVLALHNTLDEQNQRLLIDNIMEGQIDDVVDFAIQNRN